MVKYKATRGSLFTEEKNHTYRREVAEPENPHRNIEEKKGKVRRKRQSRSLGALGGYSEKSSAVFGVLPSHRLIDIKEGGGRERNQREVLTL